MELTWSHVPSRMMMSWVQLDSTGGDRIVQRKGFFFFKLGSVAEPETWQIATGFWDPC